MCYFFFKQKTAYEMRISDWSSDVCSSDLARALAARKEVGQHRNRGGRQRRFADADADTARHHLPIGPGERAQSGHETPRGNAPGDQALARTVVEVGRTSCRGRGGQYVEILVVAVSIKKKKYKNTHKKKQSQQ